MKRIYIFLILLSALLFAQDTEIDTLLSGYRDSRELYDDTKELKNGHVVIYSRSDLDKMQAYTLNDVLKTIKLFTLMSTKLGMTSLVKSPYSEKTISSVKIYIDSYEVTSLTSGTGLTQFGRMGLNHIDHIEVYQASNAIVFNGEPGTMVIKLHTKDPSVENVTAIQTSIDSTGGSRAQAIEAKSFDGYTYLANLDFSNYNSNEYKQPNGAELSRDGKRGQFYVNLAKKDDFKAEMGSAIEKDKLFSGFGKSINSGEFYTQSYYAQFTKYFDNNIKLILNASYETVNITNGDSIGILLKDSSISKLLETDTGSYTYNAILEKRLNHDNNKLLFGTQVKQRSFFIDKFKSNGIDKSLAVGPKDLNIYMFYAEDEYSINDNNILTFGAKLDIYDNHQTPISTQNVLRVGYLANLSSTRAFKMFVENGYFYPLFSETTFSPLYYTNPKLESVKSLITKAELEQKLGNLTLTFGGAFSKTKDNISYNPVTKIYVTNHDTVAFGQFYVNGIYKINADNKIRAEYFRAEKEGAEYNPNDGALLQVYSKIDRFDIYNELIYRSAYNGVYNQKISTGVDYTAGVIYHYAKNLDLKLKGENIFDKASRIGINDLKVAPYDRRVILTLEYIF